jgi:hypothetical protein
MTTGLRPNLSQRQLCTVAEGDHQHKEMAMQQVLHPYVTAGVAIVGASLIAATPVIAPLPDSYPVHDVALTADGSPLGDFLAPWIDQYNTAAENFTQLANNFALAPFVGLQQFLANQADFAQQILNDPAPSNIADVVNQTQENWASVLSAFTLLNLLNATDLSIFTTFITKAHTLDGGVDFATGELGHDAFIDALELVLPADQAATITPILDSLSSPLSGIIIGSLGPALSPWVALVNGINDGDSLNEILANMVGSVFNGATLNLDSLIPLIAQSNLLPLPSGMAITHLDFALGGLFSPGEVSNDFPYELFDSSGNPVVSVDWVGGSLFNEVGFTLTGAPPPFASGILDVQSQPIGPIGAWEGWSQTIAGLLGGKAWDGFTGGPADPPLTGWSLPLVPDDIFDDGGAGGAAADLSWLHDILTAVAG